MRWGEHGHGGYDSHAKAYIQGGQPLDDGIATLGIYLDFEDAKKNGDWKMMRAAVSELRKIRAKLNISLAEERAERQDISEEETSID